MRGGVFYPLERTCLFSLHHLFKGTKEPPFFQKTIWKYLLNVFPNYIFIFYPLYVLIGPVDQFDVQVLVQDQ